MKLALLFLCAASLLIKPGKGNGSFCYDEEDCGPKSWEDTCNKGRSQSPININSNHKILSKARKAQLYYSRDYCQNQDFILQNNGHTIQASVRADLTSTSYLQGGKDNLANKRYVFSQLHFHWGSNKDHGTEHTFNNKSYAMEGHFVHYSSEFNSFTEAVDSNEPNAVVVVGVVYALSNEDNPAFTPVLKAMSKLKKAGDSTTGTKLNLVELLPDQERFYNFQYNGSLTTPGCAEVVLWNVIGNRGRISQTQLQQFQLELDGHSKILQDNVRPAQSLNNREIRVYDTQITLSQNSHPGRGNGGILFPRRKNQGWRG
ncbi:unnamed protein product [Allacma fusca]|uniref:Alpha-carbonic anhydrase domain-containing protein n=1 Tax=Allacma fusca TaxID=39272 RepID=A0A8J2JJI6_9HEXA|nr:unnamed protein product [Allacma fusca]